MDDQPRRLLAGTNRMWLWVVLGILIIGVGVWYAIAQKYKAPQRANTTNSTNQIVKNQNTNSAMNNTNTVSDSSTLEFSNLFLRYPSAWTVKTIVGSPDCRGFVSPELVSYNSSFAANTNVDSTDAVITNDVTVCSQGNLIGSLQSVAEKWVDNLGGTINTPQQMNDPFMGAIRYGLSSIRDFDVVFFEQNGIVVRAVLEKLPYPDPTINQRKITQLLQSVK